jgi:hypothetical protein
LRKIVYAETTRLFDSSLGGVPQWWVAILSTTISRSIESVSVI